MSSSATPNEPQPEPRSLDDAVPVDYPHQFVTPSGEVDGINCTARIDDAHFCAAAWLSWLERGGEIVPTGTPDLCPAHWQHLLDRETRYWQTQNVILRMTGSQPLPDTVPLENAADDAKMLISAVAVQMFRVEENPDRQP